MFESVSDLSAKVKSAVTRLYNATIGLIVNNLFKKPSSILFLGVDNAGKTTLVNKLKNNQNAQYIPTRHATKEAVCIGNLKAMIVDVGGHRQARLAWKDYFYKIDGVIFLVDVADEMRFDEVQESWNIVRSLAGDVPVVVLMNKIDTLDHTSSSIAYDTELKNRLEDVTGIKPEKNVNIVYLSVVEDKISDKNSPIFKAFAWLADNINEAKQ